MIKQIPWLKPRKNVSIFTHEEMLDYIRQIPAELNDDLARLDISIYKWSVISEHMNDGDMTSAMESEDGPDNCALCNKYYTHDATFSHGCPDCPIRIATGKPFCAGTSYEAFAFSEDDDEIPYDYYFDIRTKAAKEMVELLQEIRDDLT